jgi:hypothetical protein
MHGPPPGQQRCVAPHCRAQLPQLEVTLSLTHWPPQQMLPPLLEQAVS